MTPQLHVSTNANGSSQQVVLNGQDIAKHCTGVDIFIDPNGATASLSLSLFEVVVDGAVTLHLSEATRTLLVDFGWTPPTDVVTP